MYKLKSARKALAFISCAALSLGIITSYPALTNDGSKAEAARTIAEIQEERKANAQKIADLEDKISNVEGEKNYEKQQAAYLEEQIKIINENINLLEAELKSIEEDITATETNIVSLDADIVNQQTTIDEKVELFKERLCTMYKNSNDTSASMVLGSSSFYDMMSRVHMINRIAEYDDKLIDEIVTEIEALEQSKKDLETEKLNLSMKLEEQTKRKEEKAAEMEVYNEKMTQTQDEIDRLAREQQMLELDKKEREEMDAMFAAEEQAWYDEIRRHEEEEQRRYEEEQKRLQELQQQQQQQQQNNNNSGGATVAPPAYVAPPSSSQTDFISPTPGFRYVSSPFGPRWGSYHNGVDIGDAGINGSTCVASRSGTVISVVTGCPHFNGYGYCNCGGGYGNYIIISHDGTYSTVYAHLSAVWVSVGESVSQGQAIGAVGSSGRSTGPHLHFEIRVNGSPVNPQGAPYYLY